MLVYKHCFETNQNALIYLHRTTLQVTFSSNYTKVFFRDLHIDPQGFHLGKGVCTGLDLCSSSPVSVSASSSLILMNAMFTQFQGG